MLPTLELGPSGREAGHSRWLVDGAVQLAAADKDSLAFFVAPCSGRRSLISPPENAAKAAKTINLLRDTAAVSSTSSFASTQRYVKL